MVSKDRPTYIYLMRSNQSGLTKIGISKDPAKRLKCLRWYVPTLNLLIASGTTRFGKATFTSNIGITNLWVMVPVDRGANSGNAAII